MGHGKLRQLLLLLTATVTRFPRLTVLVASLAAMTSLTWMLRDVQMRTQRHDLVSPQNPSQKRWLQFRKAYDSRDEIVLVVCGRRPADIEATIDSIDTFLRAHPEDYRYPIARLETGSLRAKAWYWAPQETIDSLLRTLRQAGARSADELWAVLSELPDEATVGADALAGYQYLQPGRIAIASCQPARQVDGLTPDMGPFDRLRRLATELEAQREVRVGLTGLPVIESDEMTISQHDSRRAAAASFAGVAALAWICFGGARYPSLALLALAIGLAWACGLLMGTIGHLNILTASFGIILIGLGIDFAVHYLLRYRHYRRRGIGPRQAVLLTAAQTGPAIATGAATTAAAFYATCWTPFAGVAELGWIAGCGVLCCLAAALLVLPAMLLLTDQTDGQRSTRIQPAGVICWAKGGYGLLTICWKRPRWVFSILVVGTLAIPVATWHRDADPHANRFPWYDFNLLNLQARNLPSVQWERLLLQTGSQSNWFAVCEAKSRDQAQRMQHELEKLPAVARVDNPWNWLPDAANVRQKQLWELAWWIGNAQRQSGPAAARQNRQAIAPAAWWEGTGRLQSAIGMHRHRGDSRFERAAQLKSSLLLPPPVLEDLPEAVRQRFVSRNGHVALRVYPREDIWQMPALERFVRQLQQVDPWATGQPVQTYYGSRQMLQSYLHAAIYSAIAVFLLLWWQYQRLDSLFWAALPTVVSFGQLLLLLRYLGISLNPANIIALPLIIGIGIDDAVHVVHEMRGRRTSWPSQATAGGILLTSLTSVIGFGSLALARHQGLSSLGLVVSLGVACCCVNSLLLLPALMRWRQAEKAGAGQSFGRSSSPGKSEIGRLLSAD